VQSNAAQYLAHIVGDITLSRPMKVVMDSGNGVGGAFAGDLLRALGCEVVELFCEVDGNFPNHHPDPAKPENLRDVIHALQTTDAELGLALDGDGDRLGVVTKTGNIIYPDRQLGLYAADVLSRNPGGTIVFDVKCSANTAKAIEAAGGKPLMYKTGHSIIKAKMKELGAPLAGEMSGHIFWQDRWFGFDDGLYTAARLLEIVSRSADASAVLNALPDSVATPEINLKVSEGEQHRICSALQQLDLKRAFPSSHTVHTLDGVRAEYADGFALARASNTTPVIVCRFEASSTEGLRKNATEMIAAIRSVTLSTPNLTDAIFMSPLFKETP
jgi:phosphomannomutase